MSWWLLIAAALLIGFANGANDNLKGVATLLGSRTVNYRGAVIWATATTALGSVAATLLAGHLISSFGGKGLVDDTVAAHASFAAAVALGAGATVMLATRVGMPVSTTHGLIGALIGAGSVSGSTLNLETLTGRFLVPLVASPLVAIAITSVVYPLLRRGRQWLGITRDLCLCVGSEPIETVPLGDHVVALRRADALSASLGSNVTCEYRYGGRLLGMSAGRLLDGMHFLSSGIVCFARGLNDTPKIAALLLLVPGSLAGPSLVVIGAAMALGGVLAARRVTETMSCRITTMNHGQGFTANVATGAVVLSASYLGLPVSTTHVSCGALFGIAPWTGRAQPKTILMIVLAWVVTLPLAATFAATASMLLAKF